MENGKWKHQDKASKRSPLLLNIIFLLFASACGLCIFAVSVRQQTNRFGKRIPVKFQTKQACTNVTLIRQQASHYLHFPSPQTFSREECSCNPVHLFAIVSMQRSGSGCFETLLNSHVNVSSNGEIFGSKERRANVSALYRTLDKVYNLDWLSSASKNECSAAIGFKWMLNQGLLEFHEQIEEYFNTRKASMIFLFRRNLARRMVSLLANAYDKANKPLNGVHKSHVHSPHEAQVLARYKPSINVTQLVKDLKGADRKVKKALECFKSTRHIVIYYEDVVKNRTKLVEVQEFLNLPMRNLTSLQVKIHGGPLSRQIENWEEVTATLRKTPFEKFILTDS